MIIDVNVYSSRWPFRRLYGDTREERVAKLTEAQVIQAWVGSFDALLHRDVAAVNDRLAEECRHEKRLVPFGCVNPMLPDWREDLRRCHEVHRMPGIRLHPNYHGYSLADAEPMRLLAESAARGLIVELPLVMEDERTLHPLVRVPPVSVEPLREILPRLPGLRLVLLNAFRSQRPENLKALTAAGQVYCDIATLEGVAGITKLLENVPADRILFGSYFPFFYWESAGMKLDESELNEDQRMQISHANAAGLVTP